MTIYNYWGKLLANVQLRTCTVIHSAGKDRAGFGSYVDIMSAECCANLRPLIIEI